MSASHSDFLELLGWGNLRAALLVVLVGIVLYAFRTRPGAERHALWLTASLACLALPLLSALLPTLAIPVLSSAAPEPLASAAREIPVEATGSGGLSAAPTAALPAVLPIDLSLVCFLVYLLGVTAMLGRCALSLLGLVRLEHSMTLRPGPEVVALAESLARDLGIGRPVALLVSDRIASPVTWGFLRPRIALPAAATAWPNQRLRYALLHELGHVRRLDWLLLGILNLVAALYWFNPLVRIAIRQCAFEAERACDDLVLSRGGKSSDYAEQLLDLMTASRSGSLPVLALGGSDFARRIRAILDSTREVRTMHIPTTRFAAGAVAIAAIALAACQVTGQPVADDGGLSSSTPGQAGVEAQAPDARLSDTESATRLAQQRRDEVARDAALRAELEQRDLERRDQAIAETEARIVEARGREDRLQAEMQTMVQAAQQAMQQLPSQEELQAMVQAAQQAMQQMPSEAEMQTIVQAARQGRRVAEQAARGAELARTEQQAMVLELRAMVEQQRGVIAELRRTVADLERQAAQDRPVAPAPRTETPEPAPQTNSIAPAAPAGAAQSATATAPVTPSVDE